MTETVRGVPWLNLACLGTCTCSFIDMVPEGQFVSQFDSSQEFFTVGCTVQQETFEGEKFCKF